MQYRSVRRWSAMMPSGAMRRILRRTGLERSLLGPVYAADEGLTSADLAEFSSEPELWTQGPR